MPFAPVKGFTGSDYLSIRPDYKTIEDPFGSGRVILVPPINADVCFLHGFYADGQGNVLMDRTSDSDLAAKGAGKVVVSVEEKVKDLDRARTGRMKYLSGLHVDYLVLAPRGAHPTSCPDRYPLDAEYIKAYLAAYAEGRVREWLEKEIMKGGAK